MHEYSVVQSFIELCEEYVRENQCQRVLEAKVKVGVLSGIEMKLFERALETFKAGTILQEAQIECFLQPLELECLECHQYSISSKLEKICPLCQSGNVEIRDGEEMMLMHLEME